MNKLDTMQNSEYY